MRGASAILLLWSALSVEGCRRGRRPESAWSEDAHERNVQTPKTPVDDESRLHNVVDPWSWPRARDASDRERALEDIGPYEEQAATGVAPATTINSNADYWTHLVGIAWTRDVDIDFDNQPVDLDGDGLPDTRITRHIHAKGGVLGNAGLFGLVPTPDDPRGRRGRVSVSTGVLGLREALTPDGQASGQIGMTCFLCHGGRDPVDGRVVLGLPGTAFDYGLLLATAAVLDDANTVAADYRRTHRFPTGREVRARLLLAGPGRQDLTGEFGLDVTVPGIHSMRYAGTRRVRQGTSGIVNPISVPGILAAAGLDLQNWSGSEVASVRWLRRVLELGKGSGTETLRGLGLPDADVEDLRASVAARRALLLDLRNLGTLGLQQDSFPGLLWADAVYGHTNLSPQDLTAIPTMYAAASIRRVLARESLTPTAAAVSSTAISPADAAARAAAVARGRDIFANRVVGVIANRQILKEAPVRYAAIKPGGADHAPIVAPIDEALPPKFAVRCADCHNATPGGAFVPVTQVSPPFGRCSHCHYAHVTVGDRATESPHADDEDRHLLSWFRWPTRATAEISHCSGCHARHRPMNPVAYSSSLLLPFDTDGDGAAQDDERDDARAGGIGTEALLAFDVPRPQRPAPGFGLDLPSLSTVHSVGPVATTHIGVGWVRVAPLLGVRATAPYLHNGSVPTLRALLEPAHRRPVTFSLGNSGFVFDTRVPGNRNIGHEFGTNLSALEKDDVVAFLETL